MNTNFHTESRMREICTYGSMRGIRRKTAKHVLRVAEGRADVPDEGRLANVERINRAANKLSTIAKIAKYCNMSA